MWSWIYQVIFHCGFHSSACQLMLVLQRVWQLQPYFLSPFNSLWYQVLVTPSPKFFVGNFFWPVIVRILLKELLIKVCNLRVTVLVTFHVQQPHNSTHFTLLSKILNFIHLLSCWDTYIGISCAKTPFASLSFVLHLHLSHLLWKPKLPRHWNCSTCLMTHFLSFSAKFFYLHTC